MCIYFFFNLFLWVESCHLLSKRPPSAAPRRSLSQRPPHPSHPPARLILHPKNPDNTAPVWTEAVVHRTVTQQEAEGGTEPDRILHEGRGQGQPANPRLLFSPLIFCTASQEARAGGCVSVHRMSRHEGKDILERDSRAIRDS